MTVIEISIRNLEYFMQRLLENSLERIYVQYLAETAAVERLCAVPCTNCCCGEEFTLESGMERGVAENRKGKDGLLCIVKDLV